jgi:hypothetical protein
MSQNPKYGRAEPAGETNVSGPAIDMFDGNPVPPSFGKTKIPVTALQGPTLNFAPDVLALQLRLTLRPGTTPEQAALDLFRLYAAVNQADLSHGGAGLLPRDASCAEPQANGSVSVTFQPADPHGAAERLAGVASAITELVKFASVEACEARVVAVAA